MRRATGRTRALRQAPAPGNPRAQFDARLAGPESGRDTSPYGASRSSLPSPNSRGFEYGAVTAACTDPQASGPTTAHRALVTPDIGGRRRPKTSAVLRREPVHRRRLEIPAQVVQPNDQGPPASAALALTTTVPEKLVASAAPPRPAGVGQPKSRRTPTTALAMLNHRSTAIGLVTTFGHNPNDHPHTTVTPNPTPARLATTSPAIC